MTLTSPETYAQIVDNYLDAWRKRGWMPDCRSNNLPGWTQGGSSGDVIVGHFAVNYHDEANELGISLDDIFGAQLAGQSFTLRASSLALTSPVQTASSTLRSGTSRDGRSTCIRSTDMYPSTFSMQRALGAKLVREAARSRYVDVPAPLTDSD